MKCSQPILLASSDIFRGPVEWGKMQNLQQFCLLSVRKQQYCVDLSRSRWVLVIEGFYAYHGWSCVRPNV